MSERGIGRPAGRRYVTASLTVTPEQYTFINRKPNASEFFRALLDSLMELEALMAKKSRLREKADEPINKNYTWNHFAIHYDKYAKREREEGDDDEDWAEKQRETGNMVLDLDEHGQPIPTDDAGKVLLQLRVSALTEMEAVNVKIANVLEKVKAELLSS